MASILLKKIQDLERGKQLRQLHARKPPNAKRAKESHRRDGDDPNELRREINRMQAEWCHMEASEMARQQNKDIFHIYPFIRKIGRLDRISDKITFHLLDRENTPKRTDYLRKLCMEDSGVYLFEKFEVRIRPFGIRLDPKGQDLPIVRVDSNGQPLPTTYLLHYSIREEIDGHTILAVFTPETQQPSYKPIPTWGGPHIYGQQGMLPGRSYRMTDDTMLDESTNELVPIPSKHSTRMRFRVRVYVSHRSRMADVLDGCPWWRGAFLPIWQDAYIGFEPGMIWDEFKQVILDRIGFYDLPDAKEVCFHWGLVDQADGISIENITEVAARKTGFHSEEPVIYAPEDILGSEVVGHTMVATIRLDMTRKQEYEQYKRKQANPTFVDESLLLRPSSSSDLKFELECPQTSQPPQSFSATIPSPSISVPSAASLLPPTTTQPQPLLQPSPPPLPMNPIATTTG